MTIHPDILSSLEAFENDVSLFDEHAFSRRADAIDYLEYHVLTGLLDANEFSSSPQPSLKNRTDDLIAALKKADKHLFDKLRRAIRTGNYRGGAFKQMLGEYFDLTDAVLSPGAPEYDNIDLFVNQLFPLTESPEPAAIPEPEMVFYQKTPARLIIELVDRCNFNRDDVFVDIGSGLGQAAILVNLLAGIRTIGIEFDPAFCRCAQACANSLNLPDVSFVKADARQADYSDGTVFFMFTPFRGKMLREVLQRLHAESLSRKIRLITYGPCTAEVVKEGWLNYSGPEPPDEYRLAYFSA